VKLINFLKLIYFKILSANKVAKLKGVHFGKNCKFLTKNFGSEAYLIYIGDDFYSSSNVRFITHDGSVNVLRNLYDKYKNIDLFAPIIIGNNVFIGNGVTILPGTTIEDNVIIGAGSIVKGVLKANSVYAGVPTKYISSLDNYKEKNEKNFLNTKHLNKIDKEIFLKKWIKEKYPHIGDTY
jgi:acetyltransferase-like isoleucine patch superfamily enzyme